MSRICQGPDSNRRRELRRQPIVDLGEVRVSLLAEEIADQIREGQGSVVRLASEVGDVAHWRQAARRAGRILGVPVRTGVAEDGSRVWAVDNS
jgi:hypothetical protein